jgi:plastocyanin
MKLSHVLSASLGICVTLSGTALGQNGSVTGTVKFAGASPPQNPYAVSSAYLGCGKSQPLDRLVLGKDNGVANSVVYIEGLKKTGPASTTPFVLDQKGCHYSPHVLVVPDGDAFTVANGDSMFHNVHGYFDATHATAFNLAEPTKGMKIVQRVKKPGMYLLRCDVHPWMNAYVFVAGNGYAAATSADGKYTLSNVPPGTYKLVLWHEGWKSKDEGGRPDFSEAVQQSQQITVVAAKSTTADFNLK